MSGVPSKSRRTSGSHGVNAVANAASSYLGGRSQANARATVARPIPKIPQNLTLRNTIRDQPTHQRPILHSDHNQSVGVASFSTALWPRFQASSTTCATAVTRYVYATS